jgi:MucR family transcriptional regulator, transcriptional regulator of exopolysaccharide biosynthesis
MSQSDTPSSPRAEDALQLTTTIVTAYLSNNAVSANDIPAIIRSVHITLESLGKDTVPGGETNLKPAVPVKKSITDDYIICLEDGKKLKMLKRYIRTRFKLSPDDYRAKWGLGPDYPMVAPNYAAKRSEFAKKIGLGRGGRARPARKGRRKAA